jgi:hypothetical protein
MNALKIQKDRKVVLSFLWIFAMFNYLYADILTLCTMQKDKNYDK